MSIFKIICVCFGVILLSVVKVCERRNNSNQESTQIRIINNTRHKLTQLSLFSMKFGDLYPNDTSQYKTLKFNQLKDDDMIYCLQDGEGLGRYVMLPDSTAKYFTYSLDSVSNGILYLSSFVEK
nr:hypothetical protein [uncultured Allomuricauda sp.]